MPKEPSGLRADRSYSYQKLERIVTHVRGQLKLSPTAAINALLLFDGHDITVKSSDGQDIPIRGTVIELEDLEGFAKYDNERRTLEIQASTTTYDWLEQDYPRGRFFLGARVGALLVAHRSTRPYGSNADEENSGTALWQTGGCYPQVLPRHGMASQRVCGRLSYASSRHLGP